uniref:Armadillo repeat-containing protein 8 n=1 Tax=Heterosigma akashiwo TaxID=2829 RepID=A0A6S9K4K5_HETAK
MAALANICRNANLLGPPCKAWRTLHLVLRPKTLWGVSSSLRYAEVEEECMLQALRLFTNASCNPIHQRRIVQQGCLTSLVDLLQHRDGTHYSTLAATCLANLSSLKANRQAMILLNIPSLLLVPLQQEAKGTQFQLARALCNLLAAADWSTKNQLTQKGLLATVLGIMKTSTDLNAPSAEKISSSQYEGPVDNLSCVRQRALSDEVRHHGIAEEEVEMGLSSDLNAICSKILSCTLTSSMQRGAAFSW